MSNANLIISYIRIQFAVFVPSIPFQKITINILFNMSLQSKFRQTKESNCNQNYINFIKKNQLFVHEELQSKSPNKSNKNIEKYATIAPIEIPPGQSKEVRQTFHNSMAKFQIGSNHIDQTSKIYHLGAVSHRQTEKSYRTVTNDEQTNAILQMRTKYAKREIAKEQITRFSKNKSIEARKANARQFLDRYKLSQAVNDETDLKFPFIEKKNLVSFSSEMAKYEVVIEALQETVRNKINAVMNQSPQRKLEQLLQERRKKEKTEISNKLRMREELYGLLPSFRSPILSLDGYANRNSVYARKSHKKAVSNSTPIVVDKMEDPSPEKSPSKTLPSQKDKEIVGVSLNERKVFTGSTFLENKEELQLLTKIDPTDENIKQNQQADTNKLKVKKQVSSNEIRHDSQLTIYDQKMRSYRQFIFMVNLAHRIYDPIILKDPNIFKSEHKYKFCLGKGNNYLLVKSLLQRRFWWTVETDPKRANFAWTQLKINYFYQYERKSCVQSKHYKLDQDFALNESPKKKKTKAVQQQPAKSGIFKAPLPSNDKKIFTNADKYHYDEYVEKVENHEKMQKFCNRLKLFQENFLRERACEEPSSQRIHNHLQYNYFIGNKKALFYNLKQYYDLQGKDVFQIVPLTYHIKNGTNGAQFQQFSKQFKRLAQQKATSKSGGKNIWIVKPGELSNRGQGITVIDEIYELTNILKKKEKHTNGTEKTYIVQKYIEKPLLYKNRKFDIRHYMMISRLHGVMRAYWYGQGYIRTSSYEYNISEIGESVIHLTNDAIQKHCDGYGKYQEGNKVSYNEFQRYMDSTYGQGKFSFAEMIYPKMKAVALDAVKATYLQLDPNNTQHNFEIFGLDFMIDSSYNVWLIEVNTNPCLELSSKLLARLIPTMVQQSFRLTLDVIFPPPCHYPNSQKYLVPDSPLDRLQFQLIFDENRDGKEIEQLYSNCRKLDMGQVDEQDETYENDGKEIELDKELE